jgi:hypothetical protein
MRHEVHDPPTQSTLAGESYRLKDKRKAGVVKTGGG